MKICLCSCHANYVCTWTKNWSLFFTLQTNIVCDFVMVSPINWNSNKLVELKRIDLTLGIIFITSCGCGLVMTVFPMGGKIRNKKSLLSQKCAKRCGKDGEGLKIMLGCYCLLTFVYSTWIMLDLIWISSFLMGCTEG